MQYNNAYFGVELQLLEKNISFFKAPLKEMKLGKQILPSFLFSGENKTKVTWADLHLDKFLPLYGTILIHSELFGAVWTQFGLVLSCLVWSGFILYLLDPF